MARKSLGKIKGGINKDKEVFVEDADGFTKVIMGDTQVACIRDGTSPEDVFKSLQPREV